MGVLHLVDQSGESRALEAVEGWRVMEILRDHGCGVDGLCGGACACGSCHVIVEEGWAARLAPPRDDEMERLDELPTIEPTSRLSCQLIWSEALDGLTLTLPEAA